MTRDAETPRLILGEHRAVSDTDAEAVAELIAAATAADGVGPIDDQVRSELSHGAGPASTHLVGHADGGGLAAYGHYTLDDDGLSGHLVVHPRHRLRGYGGALLDHLLAEPPRKPQEASAGGRRAVRIWAHGDLEAARALATARSFTRVRDLWQMHRPLDLALPAPSYPKDVTVRTFEPGRDDEPWVALNAAAFATHPEQGRLTVDDLRHRIAEPWFDAEGFFLAEREGALLGSHWTKIHPRAPAGREGRVEAIPAVGEVYAIGIHPDAQGLGLGKALTVTGLHYLRDRGLDEVMLYVDGDNPAAITLYQRLGFTKATVDVMYAKPAGS